MQLSPAMEYVAEQCLTLSPIVNSLIAIFRDRDAFDGQLDAEERTIGAGLLSLIAMAVFAGFG
jgi:hypothetical protein